MKMVEFNFESGLFKRGFTKGYIITWPSW